MEKQCKLIKARIKYLKGGTKKLVLYGQTTRTEVSLGDRYVVEYDGKKWPFRVTGIEAEEMKCLTFKIEESHDIAEEWLTDRKDFSIIKLLNSEVY